MPKLEVCNDLNNIQNINDLNTLLDNNKISVDWKGREFVLKDNQREYHVTMKQIIAQFKELSEKQGVNQEVKNSIHDKIIDLHHRGELEFSKQGLMAKVLRAAANSFYLFSSRLSELDEIKNFYDNVGDQKEELVFLSDQKIIELFNDDLPNDKISDLIVDKDLVEKNNSYKNLKVELENKENEYKNLLDIKDVFKVNEDTKIKNSPPKYYNSKSKEEFKKEKIKFNETKSALLEAKKKFFAAREDFFEAVKQKHAEKLIEQMLGDDDLIIDKIENEIRSLVRKQPEDAVEIIEYMLTALYSLPGEKPELEKFLKSMELEAQLRQPKMNKAMLEFNAKFSKYSTTPLEPLATQINLHKKAKQQLVIDLQNQGATVEFIKPSTPPEKMVPSGPLNSNVFTYEISSGVKEKIIADGKRKEDNNIGYAVLSQFNVTESKDRSLVKPERAINAYSKDLTQGPQAQLAFSDPQIKAICTAGSKGFNSICPILNSNTKLAVVNGYFTPTSENIDDAISQFAEKGHLVEYLCVKSKPVDGNKDVEQIFISAPAFGGYAIDKLDPDKAVRIQYLIARNAYRAMFEHAIQAAGGEGYTLNTAPVGLGAYGNDPNAIAKAYYDAALEYQDRLNEKKVKVVLQVYEGKDWSEDKKKKDGAHIMAEKLDLTKTEVW